MTKFERMLKRLRKLADSPIQGMETNYRLIDNDELKSFIKEYDRKDSELLAAKRELSCRESPFQGRIAATS